MPKYPRSDKNSNSHKTHSKKHDARLNFSQDKACGERLREVVNAVPDSYRSLTNHRQVPSLRAQFVGKISSKLEPCIRAIGHNTEVYYKDIQF